MSYHHGFLYFFMASPTHSVTKVINTTDMDRHAQPVLLFKGLQRSGRGKNSATNNLSQILNLIGYFKAIRVLKSNKGRTSLWLGVTIISMSMYKIYPASLQSCCLTFLKYPDYKGRDVTELEFQHEHSHISASYVMKHHANETANGEDVKKMPGGKVLP